MPDKKVNSQEENSPESVGRNKMPFNEALNKVVDGLKGQPLLLFVLGFSILLISAAVLSLESLRVLLLPLLIVYAVGLICWVLLKVNNIRSSGKTATGNIKLKSMNMEGTKAQTGDAEPVGQKNGTVKSGDIIFDKSKVKDSQFKTGSVKNKS